MAVRAKGEFETYPGRKLGRKRRKVLAVVELKENDFRPPSYPCATRFGNEKSTAYAMNRYLRTERVELVFGSGKAQVAVVGQHFEGIGAARE